MYLLLDLGNSRCKYLLSDALPVVVAQGSEEYELGSWDNQSFNQGFWEKQLQRFQSKKLSKVFVSSVAGKERKEWLEAICQQVLGLTPIFAESTEAYVSEKLGQLRNSYDNPVALGVDRWLAMIAAFEQSESEFMVIDAGTAITTDWVSKDGQHQGGHIVAGGRMLQQSLLGGTGGIAWSASHDGELKGESFGVNTSAAVALGAETMIKGYWGQLMKDLADQAETKAVKLFVTGGDGDFIVTCLQEAMKERQLEYSVSYQPHLVLEGLSYWFSLNN